MLRLTVIFLLSSGTVQCAFESPYFYAAARGAGCSSPARIFPPERDSCQRELRIALGVTPAPFGLSQLQSTFVKAAVSLPFGSVYLSATHAGFDLYSELCLSAGARIWIGPLTFGLGVSSFFLAIADYGSTQSVGMDVSIGGAISDDLAWSAAASNINGATLGPREGELPQILATGLAYLPVRGATIAIEVIKDIRYPLEVHLGLEYRPIDAVAFRAGVTTNPSLFCAGVGLALSGVELDYALNMHAVLGAVHQLGLTLLPFAW